MAASGSPRKPSTQEAVLARTLGRAPSRESTPGGSTGRTGARSGSAGGGAGADDSDDEPETENPFRIPTGDGLGVFTLRQVKRLDMDARRRMHSAARTRHSKFLDKLRRRDEARLLAEESEAQREQATRQLVAQAAMSIRSRSGKENLTELIRNKREMFLIQYSLGIKRDEMRKLEEEAHARESAAATESAMLTSEAQRFEEFLLFSSDRVKKVQREEADQAKWVETLEAELRKLHEAIKDVAAKSAELERKRAKYVEFKEFLLRLTPQDWLNEQMAAKRARQAARREAKLKDRAERATVRAAERERRAAVLPDEPRALSESGSSSAHESESDSSGLELPMFFTTTDALVQVFHALEKADLQMVTQAHDTEGALETLRSVFNTAISERVAHIAELKAKLAQHTADVERDSEKLRRAQAVKAIFDAQALAAPKAQLDALFKRIETLYVRCIVRSPDDASVQLMGHEEMLAAVERGLEALRQTVATEFADESDKVTRRLAELYKERLKQSRSSNWELQERQREAKKVQRMDGKRSRGGTGNAAAAAHAGDDVGTSVAPRVRLGKPLMRRYNHFVHKAQTASSEDKHKEREERRYFFE